MCTYTLEAYWILTLVMSLVKKWMALVGLRENVYSFLMACTRAVFSQGFQTIERQSPKMPSASLHWQETEWLEGSRLSVSYGSPGCPHSKFQAHSVPISALILHGSLVKLSIPWWCIQQPPQQNFMGFCLFFFPRSINFVAIGNKRFF